MKHVFTKSNVVALIIALILGVIAFSISLHRNRSRFPNSFVMKYSEFGAPGSSDELLRSESSQGSGQRPDDPSRSDDIQIVVYRNVDLATVKRTYPELGAKSVYRFVEYSQAIDYLDKKIEELKANNRDAEYGKLKEELISGYEQIRTRIVERLGP
jgi:hypothetical protein